MHCAHGSGLPSISELQDNSRLKQVQARAGQEVLVDRHTEKRPYFRSKYMRYTFGGPTHNHEVVVPDGTIVEFTELPPDLHSCFRTRTGKLRGIIVNTLFGPRLRSTYSKRLHRSVFPFRDKRPIRFIIKRVPKVIRLKIFWHAV
jgi:hypothetical protein